VVCFEPDISNAGFLRKNIKRHSLENVTVVEAAVGGADGTAQFISEGTLGSGLSSVIKRYSAGDVITVPVIALRSAFEKYGVPNLCKIDIEGAEIDALEAALDSFRDFKINFVVDTAHIVGGEYTDKRVESIFRRAGYETLTVRKDFATGSEIITYGRPA
jgi:FkbM family methyltransferase